MLPPVEIFLAEMHRADKDEHCRAVRGRCLLDELEIEPPVDVAGERRHAGERGPGIRDPWDPEPFAWYWLVSQPFVTSAIRTSGTRERIPSATPELTGYHHVADEQRGLELAVEEVGQVLEVEVVLGGVVDAPRRRKTAAQSPASCGLYDQRSGLS